MSGVINSLRDVFCLIGRRIVFINDKSDNEQKETFKRDSTSLTTKSSLLLDAIHKNSRYGIESIFADNGIEFLFETSQTNDTPLHWTCIAGDVEIVKLFKELYIKYGGENIKPWKEYINIRNALLQTPLHWACTVENVALVSYMLREGADIDATDSKSVTPLIMCCQHNNLSGAVYLVLNGCDINHCDVEGDNALHWSNYKGNPELSRFLVFSGLDPGQPDNFGQTPLHFACLSGNANCVKDLCEKENIRINTFDRNNKSPMMLAAGRRQYRIVNYLKLQINVRMQNISAVHKLKYIVFGSPFDNRIPMLFFFVCALLIGDPFYAIAVRPVTLAHHFTANLIFLVCQCLTWLCFIFTLIKDPGLEKENRIEYQRLLQEIKSNKSYDNMKGKDYRNPINLVCHSCRKYRSPRSKHCKTCDRCVDEMDHHCPYVGNCIGSNNRFWFMLFLLFLNATNISVAYLFYKAFVYAHNVSVFSIITTLVLLLGLIVGLTINVFLCKLAFGNLTLVEMQKWKKYNYLHDEFGKFSNPFDKGCLRNCFHFMNLK